MNVGIGKEVVQFHFRKHINRIFGTVNVQSLLLSVQPLPLAASVPLLPSVNFLLPITPSFCFALLFPFRCISEITCLVRFDAKASEKMHILFKVRFPLF
jgi:hypothetical protein